MTDKPSKAQIFKQDFFAALMLLTRIPVKWDKISPDHPPNMHRCLWAYPFVGMLLGSITAIVYFGFSLTTIPSSVAVVITLCFLIFLTGAFHEDGLADTADGFGGGHDKQAKLEIMRDSRIGTYGGLALIAAFLIKIFALIELSQTEVIKILIIAAVYSRLMILIMLILLEPAREDSLSTQSGKPSGNILLFAIAGSLFVAGLIINVRVALIMFVVAVTITYLFSRLARRQVGGYSGDILGASQQISEITIYVTAVSIGSFEF